MIDPHCVRLAFQAFVLDGSDVKHIIQPIVSNSIQATQSNNQLVINEVSDTIAPVCGGKKIILLCKKVRPNEIGLRFYQKNHNGARVWQTEVKDKTAHFQVAISFKTPAYIDQDIEEPVKVYLEMFYEDGECVSNSIEFEFLPIDSNLRMKRKRKRVQEQDYCEYFLGTSLAIMAITSHFHTNIDSFLFFVFLFAVNETKFNVKMLDNPMAYQTPHMPTMPAMQPTMQPTMPGPSNAYHQNILGRDQPATMSRTEAPYPHTSNMTSASTNATATGIPSSHTSNLRAPAAMQFYQNLIMPPQPTAPANGQPSCDIFYPHMSAYMPTQMGAFNLNQRSLPMDQQLSMANLQHFQQELHHTIASNNGGYASAASNHTVMRHPGPQQTLQEPNTSQQFSFDQLQPMRIEPPIDANHFNDLI